MTDYQQVALTALENMPMWAMIAMGILSVSYHRVFRGGFQRVLGLGSSALTFGGGALAGQQLQLESTDHNSWWMVIVGIVLFNVWHHAKAYKTRTETRKDRYGDREHTYKVKDGRQPLSIFLGAAAAALALIPANMAETADLIESQFARFGSELSAPVEIDKYLRESEAIVYDAGQCQSNDSKVYVSVIDGGGATHDVYINKNNDYMMPKYLDIKVAFDELQLGQREYVIAKLSERVTGVNEEGRTWEIVCVELSDSK